MMYRPSLPAGLPRRCARVARAALGSRWRVLLRPRARAPVPGSRAAQLVASEAAGLPGATAPALPAQRERRALLTALQTDHRGAARRHAGAVPERRRGQAGCGGPRRAPQRRAAGCRRGRPCGGRPGQPAPGAAADRPVRRHGGQGRPPVRRATQSAWQQCSVLFVWLRLPSGACAWLAEGLLACAAPVVEYLKP